MGHGVPSPSLLASHTAASLPCTSLKEPVQSRHPRPLLPHILLQGSHMRPSAAERRLFAGLQVTHGCSWRCTSNILGAARSRRRAHACTWVRLSSGPRVDRPACWHLAACRPRRQQCKPGGTGTLSWLPLNWLACCLECGLQFKLRGCYPISIPTALFLSLHCRPKERPPAPVRRRAALFRGVTSDKGGGATGWHVGAA